MAQATPLVQFRQRRGFCKTLWNNNNGSLFGSVSIICSVTCGFVHVWEREECKRVMSFCKNVQMFFALCVLSVDAASGSELHGYMCMCPACMPSLLGGVVCFVGRFFIVFVVHVVSFFVFFWEREGWAAENSKLESAKIESLLDN